MTSRPDQVFGSMIFDAGDVTAMKRKIGKLNTRGQYINDKGYTPALVGTIIGQRFKLDVVQASQYCANLSNGCTLDLSGAFVAQALNVPANTQELFGSTSNDPAYTNTSMRAAEGIGNL